MPEKEEAKKPLGVFRLGHGVGLRREVWAGDTRKEPQRVGPRGIQLVVLRRGVLYLELEYEGP